MSASGTGGVAKKPESVGFRLDSSRPWPELLYRFAEHYKWEPAHLCKGQSIEAFYERIRRQEVPLNFALDLLLAWLSADAIRSLLEPFGLPDGLEGELLRPCFPLDVGYTQPDVTLLSDRSRVFIELKWKAHVTLAQVQKYLLLHADLDGGDAPRRPFLLFLTRDEFWRCWKPRGEISADTDPGEFLKAKLASTSIPDSLPARATGDAIRALAQAVTFGFTTWEAFTRHIVGQVIPQLESAGRTAEHAAIAGFAADLHRRLREK